MLADIHSHFLPAVDDGAKDLEEALELLKLMKSQGITHAIATPHYYPLSCPAPREHKIEIEKSFSSLLPHLTEEHPNISLGHEVHYFGALPSSEQIKELKMGNSEYFLLELPYEKWGIEMEDAIVAFALNSGLKPILAHIERYAFAPGFGAVMEAVSAGYAAAQLGCDALLGSRGMKKLALGLIKSGSISFISTDAHSPKKRPPNMLQAGEIISKKLGEDTLLRLIENANALYLKAADQI